VSVPIVSNDKCKSMFLRAGRHEYIPDIFMCAGFDDGGRDSCQVSRIQIFFLNNMIVIKITISINILRAILVVHYKSRAETGVTFWLAS